MRVCEGAILTEPWDYQNSENVITAIAFLCDEPSWIKNENGIVMGLYVVDRKKVWLEVSKVEERKKKPFVNSATIDEVAKLMANKLIIDDRTNEVMFRYVLDDGRIAEYSSTQILRKRSELSRSGFGGMKNYAETEVQNEI